MTTYLLKAIDRVKEAKMETEYLLHTKLMEPQPYAVTLGRAQALKGVLDTLNEYLKFELGEDKDGTLEL